MRRNFMRTALTFLPVLFTTLFSAVLAEENSPAAFRISFLTPADGGVVFGRTPISIEVESADPVNLAAVHYFLDGNLIGKATEYPWEFVFDFGEKAAECRLKAVASDTQGRFAEAEITIVPPLRGEFVSKVDAVTLDVAVTDRSGKLVPGLDKEDFEVFENGRPIDIRYFSALERPLHVAIVLDTSGSMTVGGKIENARIASQQFVSSLDERDRVMVVTCGPWVREICHFTSDFESTGRKLGRIRARIGAGTPLKLAITKTLDAFAKFEGRKALLIVSDGDDSEVVNSPKKLIEAAKKADVKIYAIGLPGSEINHDDWLKKSKAARLLSEIAGVTGGHPFFPRSPEELPGAFATVFDELRSQYSLGYKPPGKKDGRWRSITVKLRPPGLVARTKEGYYADNR